MDRLCEIVRQALEEADWDPSHLSDEQQRHLEECRPCSQELAVGRRLARLLVEAVPDEDVELQRATLLRVSPGVSGRLLSLAPAVIGGALMAWGATAVGGFPGAGLVLLTPGLSLGAGLAAAGGLGGVVSAGGTALEAIHAVVPATMPFLAGGVAVLGTALLVMGVRRLGRSVA